MLATTTSKTITDNSACDDKTEIDATVKLAAFNSQGFLQTSSIEMHLFEGPD